MRRYRADAGLLKTLLLSSLAPEVEALRNLTPARLAALNHGTIRSPLPNGEASTVLTKVRGWASHAGEIQLSADRSEEHTSELQSLMRNSYAVFCLTKTNHKTNRQQRAPNHYN